jgi:hypothetical protein
VQIARGTKLEQLCRNDARTNHLADNQTPPANRRG